MHIRTHQWPWFAILARAGEEKNAAMLLENAGYECFLPLSTCQRRLDDGMQPTPTPLFSGYLFCRMKPQNRVPVLKTRGVIQIVGVGNTPTAIDEGEITAIQRAVKCELPTMPWPYVRVGIVARMEEGPLKGLTGFIVKIRFGIKLVLSVNLLQRSMAVEIDRQWISARQTGVPATQHRHALETIPNSLELSRLENLSSQR